MQSQITREFKNSTDKLEAKPKSSTIKESTDELHIKSGSYNTRKNLVRNHRITRRI